MQLSFQPIVERELRVAARRRSTYWSRGLAALLAGAFAIWILGVTVSTGGSVNGGRAIFTNLSVCAWVACLLAGVFLTADCLSFEKREGTLGLLFLTDLRGYDIVLGKLAATSLTGLYGLIAVFPVLALPLILGGVTWWEFARMAAALMATLLFSLSMGMLFSANNRHEHTGMVATALAIVGWTIVFGIAPGTRWLTPLGTMWFAFDQSFAVAPGHYFASLATVCLLTTGALAIAAWKLPRSWADLPSSPGKSHAAEGAAEERQRTLQTAARIRALILERNPAGWLVSRRNRPVVLWGLIGLAAGVMTLTWFSTRAISAVVPVLLVIAVHGTLKLCMAWEASHLLSEHRRTGGLELVLVTDLGVNEFLRGCRAALRQRFGSITLVVILLDVALGALAFAASLSAMGPGAVGDPMTGIFIVILVLVGMLLVDLWSLSWVGLWLGLRHRWPWQAALSAIARVIALPWAIAFAGMLLEGATVGGMGWPVALVMVWVLAGFGLSYAFGRHARESIHAELREEICAWMPGNVRRKPVERPINEEYYELVR